jgi:predicted RNA-binding Zn ribbon-like protein
MALDFANTCSGRGGAHHIEHLQLPEHVVAWAKHAGLLSKAEAEALSRNLDSNPRKAGEFLARARALRHAIYDIAATSATGAKPRDNTLRELVQCYRQTLTSATLVPAAHGLALSWPAALDDLNAVLGPIAQSALHTFTDHDMTRLKQCPGTDCGWVFLDTSKNRSRRWCEMRLCGNRSKVRAARGRARSEGTGHDAG